jgi:hypothetical protein
LSSVESDFIADLPVVMKAERVLYAVGVRFRKGHWNWVMAVGCPTCIDSSFSPALIYLRKT